jgi:hypothetical protein
MDIGRGDSEAASRDGAAERPSATVPADAALPSDPPDQVPAPVPAAVDTPVAADASGAGRPRLADALATILAGAAAEPEPAAAPPVPPATPAATPAVRALTLRVESADYGPITVRVTLAGPSLSLQVRPESEPAAERLRRHRDDLATELSGLGYEVDVILAAPLRDGGSPPQAPDRPASPSAGSLSGDAGSPSAAGRDAADPEHSGRAPSDGPRQSREDDAREKPAAHRRHGDLYV